jgi:hypothetical protein
MAGHQRTADTPAGGGGRANGRTPRRAADRGGAILRMGIHAYAMGEGRIRREPQRGGREDVSTGAVAPGGQRGKGRRQRPRPLQNTHSSRGGGRYIKRGAAERAAVTESGRRRFQRPLQEAAVTGGRYGTGSGRRPRRRPLHKQCHEAGCLSISSYLVFTVTSNQKAPCYNIPITITTIIIPLHPYPYRYCALCAVDPMAAVCCQSNPPLSFLSTIIQ